MTALELALSGFVSVLAPVGLGAGLLLVDDAAMRVLNHTHRGKDAPTDVLSWCYEADNTPVPNSEEGALWGEMAISVETAARQAAENGWALQTEVLRLAAHACAHIAGHDHRDAGEEREMLKVEVELLSGVGLSGLYRRASDGEAD